MSATVVLDSYRRYMWGRGWATTTVSARLSVAIEWCDLYGDDLEAPTHRDVEAWAAGRDVSPASTRNLHTQLRAFYRWAQRDGLVRFDPTALADAPRVPARLPRPAPERDIQRVLARGDVQLRAIVALMSCAGLRCVECSRLDWRDVQLDAATVIVNGKGRRERLIDLSPDVVRALAALAMATPGPASGAVFVGQGDRRLSAARVSQHVAAAFRDIGVTTRAHQLRHRCATMALRLDGADLLAVRDLLGHASVSTTQVYTAVVPGRTARTSRALKLPAA